MPSIPSPMNYDIAYQQAQDILQPRFKQQRKKMQRNLAQRGFYGQMPGDVIQQQLGSQQVGQTAQYAQGLQQQDWQRHMQEYQLQREKERRRQEQQQSFWGTIGTVAGTLLGGPAGGAIGGWLGSQF